MDMENNPVYGLTDQVYEEIPVKKRVEQAHSEESTRHTKERLSYKKFGYGTVAILATLLLLVGSGSIIYLVYSLQNLSSEFSRFKQIRNEMQAVQETQTLLDSNQTIKQIQRELLQLHESINVRLTNITAVQTQQYHECKQTAVVLSDTIQQQLYHTMQIQLNSTNSTMEAIQELQGRQHNSSQTIEQIQLEIMGLHESIDAKMANITAVQAQQYLECKQTTVALNDTTQDLQQQLYQTIQTQLNSTNSSRYAIQELHEHQHNSSQIIEQIQLELMGLHKSINARMANITTVHTQQYRECKQTAVALNEQTQRNLSQQIELQTVQMSEVIHTLQQQVNQSSGALQMDIENIQANLTTSHTNIDHLRLTIDGLLTALNTSTSDETPTTCEGLPPPANGEVSVAAGPNSLSHGLGSVATYACNPGYAPVGKATRVCEDTLGGTVTTGMWSGAPSTCQDIHCSGLAAPANGSVLLSNQSLIIGTTATYSCDTGFILVGERNRTCQYRGGQLLGMWSGTNPRCEVILCSELSPPENGTISLNSGVTQLLGVGTTATYSCDSGFVLVGQTNRTCQERGGQLLGMWSGTRPRCEGATPNRPLIDCQDTACRYEQLVCPDQENCTVHCYDSRQYACFQTDLFCPSTEGDCTLNCDDSYACVQANITCPQGNCTVNCENDHTCLSSATRCSGENCLINCERRESCSNSNMECTNGNCRLNCEQYQACNRSMVMCSGENCFVDCRGSSSCQYLSAQCQNGDCILNGRAYASLSYSTVSCPPDGLCLINCTGDRSCQYSRFTCPSGGNCVFNFQNENPVYSWTGYYTSTICQENSTCSIYCTHQTVNIWWFYYSLPCSNSHITCPTESGDCTVECIGYFACQSSTIVCGRSSECLSCSGQYSCNSATITLPNPSNDIASLECTGSSSCGSASITCPENNTCSVGCTGWGSCQYASITCPENNTCSVGCTETYTCQRGTINCPRNGNCAINCNDTSTCNGARFICPENNNCTITCSGANSCQSIFLRYGSTNMTIICPTNHNCTINCDGQGSCNNATVTCPTGDYSCNILCTDPLSCSNLSITNTHNVYLQCCGGPQFCAGTTVAPSSTECPYMTN